MSIWYTLSHGSPRDEIRSLRSLWAVTVTGNSWMRSSSFWNPMSTLSLWTQQSISMSRAMVSTKCSSDENALLGVSAWNLFMVLTSALVGSSQSVATRFVFLCRDCVWFGWYKQAWFGWCPLGVQPVSGWWMLCVHCLCSAPFSVQHNELWWETHRGQLRQGLSAGLGWGLYTVVAKV